MTGVEETVSQSHALGRHVSSHPEDRAFFEKACPECAQNLTRAVVVQALLKARDAGALTESEYADAYNAVFQLTPARLLWTTQ